MDNNLSHQDIQRIQLSYGQETIPTQTYASIFPQYKRSMDFGRQLRDSWIHQYSILPGAITTFVDIASSREWIVLGNPTAASRAVDRLNNSFTIDSYGIKHRGWEQLVSRLCIDWLCVGRCMYHSEPVTENNREWSPFKYIDPVFTLPIWDETSETIWDYRPRPYNRNQQNLFSQDVIFFTDNIRIGQSGSVIGRVAYTLPTANLDWLLRQHDSYKLDGRKVNEILYVHESLVDATRDAILEILTLADGNDPSKNKIPIMGINYDYNNVALQDLIAKLGLSEIPQGFTREEMEGRYVREISATLGLPIGQFWYDPRGTNRSLEQVQQERSTLKGPSYFIRSIMRTINNSKAMGNTPANRAVVYAEEETDNSSLALKADALDKMTKAASTLNQLMTEASLNDDANLVGPQEWLGFFQRQGLIPANMTMPDIVAMEEQSLKRSVDMTDYDRIMKKGQVRMNLDGYILEKRPHFQIQKGENNGTFESQEE